MIDAKKLFAKWTLASALIKRVVLSSFVDRDSARKWRARMRAESLAETPEASWALFAQASGCIGCGLCDAVAEGDVVPSVSIRGAARRPQDAPLVRAEADELRALATRIARICPARVDAEAIAELIDANARMLERP